MADERAVSPARTLQVADMGPLEWFAYSEAQGWGDGLPTLPPTLEAVETLLADVDPAVMADIGPIPPAGLVPDIRSLAANAVMAGCTTAAGFLIVVAALEAVLDDSFNAVGVMATTHPCTPLVLVSGSVAGAAGVNAKENCLGQGSRANATIGRALHFILVNLGGSTPGSLDRATHGSPTKYSYCFAEDEGSTPWASLAQRRGYAPGEPVVMVFAAEGPHNVNDHGSTHGDELITTMAGVIATSGSNNLYLGGDHLVVWGPGARSHSGPGRLGCANDPAGPLRAGCGPGVGDICRESGPVLEPRSGAGERVLPNRQRPGEHPGRGGWRAWQALGLDSHLRIESVRLTTSAMAVMGQ